MLGCGVHGAATRTRPSASSATRPGKIRSPSPSSRAVPHAKQVGNGCDPCPEYDAVASSASAAETSSTGTSSRSTTSALATTDPSPATATPSVTGSGVSSGGGWRSVTCTVGQAAAWSTGESWSRKPARAPAVQPPLPDEGGPQNLLGTRSSVIS